MQEMPLVCPFCDELAYRDRKKMPVMLPHKIYTRRVCTLGHEFYSVEEIPEDQAAIVDELKEIKQDAKEWKRELRTLKA